MIGIFLSRKQLLLFSAWFSLIPLGMAQNLVPNNGFETYTTCPTAFGNGGPLECTPWQNGNLATSDYFNVCAIGTDVWIPDNLFGSQTAHTGNAYAGFFAREISIWREYIQAPLISPCIAGTTYEVSFYVSLADLYCGVQHIGAYLSAAPPPSLTIGTLGVTPQVESNIGFITETNDWVLVTGCFTAQGGEQWITIGNFQTNPNTPLAPGCTISPFSYYYIDDVSVTEGEPSNTLELELGPPVATCVPYEIDPNVTEDVEYTWSDGSHNPTLMVTESGTYALTITAGCGNIGIDSVEVTFIGVPDPVQIGPEEITLCDGESYGINLDPNAGDYTWQDGSTNANYTITTPGLYQVTLNDGCDITTDEITVFVHETPPPFSLGNDVALCIGDEISYSFDPDLGDFLWQDGTTDPEYTITTGGTYSLTISNDCGSVSDAIMVTSAPQPVVDIGPASLSLCEGEDYSIALDPDAGDYVWQDGSTASNYTIQNAGTYSVTLTNSCGTATDEMAVDIMTPPVPFSLGNDTLICTGEEITFSFDPNAGVFLWQDNSNTSTYTIQHGGSYSLTISNGCGEVADAITVTEIAAPEIDLGPNTVVLCEGQQLNLAFDPQLGDFIWQDGSTSSVYVIDNAGTFAVTVTNACGTATDQMEVSVTEAPVFDLGPDVVVCPAQLPILLDISNTQNAENFIWQDNSTATQFLVTGPGVYSVTVSNTCFSITDQVVVSVGAAGPEVDLPPDQSLCEGESLVLSVSGLIGNYQWQDGSTGTTYLVTQTGDYSVTVTNACGAGTDTIHILFIDTLTAIDLGPDMSLCPGETATLQVGISGATYSWQDMSMADSFMVSQPGIYYVAVSNACNLVSDTIKVSLDSNPPHVDLTDTLRLCAGEVLEIAAGLSGVQYEWSNGSTSEVITISIPGMYTVIVSNACGSDSDSVFVVDAGSSPSVSLGELLTLCPGEQITIRPIYANVLSWLWADGSTDSSYVVMDAGMISVQVSNLCGLDTDTLEVVMLPPTPELQLGADTALCPGGQVALISPFPGEAVIWSDGSMGQVFTIDAAGVYYGTLTDQCGVSSDTIVVEMLAPAPMLELGPSQSLCPGDTIVFAPGIQEVSYAWNNGSIDTMMTCTTPGWVFLLVSNACGYALDSVWVMEDTQGPRIDLGPDVELCEGEELVLRGDLLGVEYLWQDGSTTNEMVVATPGEYRVMVSNACGLDLDTLLVTYKSAPLSFDLGPDTMICPDGFILLQAPETGDMLTWQDGSHALTMIADQEQIYELQISNDCGVASDELSITIDQRMPTLMLEDQVLNCDGDPVVLNATQDFEAEYVWSNGQKVSSVELNVPGIYAITVTTACQTISQDVVILPGENCNHQVYIPNVFSPNGDRANDYFAVSIDSDMEISSMHCSIFDRWGNQVFQSRDVDFRWDGRFKNTELLPGVYVYLIQVEYMIQEGTRSQNYTGDVTLVR